MTRNLGLVFFVIIFTSLVYGGILYLSLKESKVCDQMVRLNDGTQYEATQVLSYSSGMTSIRLCTGEVLRTPTVNIKMVEELKK
jgi:hypothetical protein